jgi:hypothetical protein
MSIVFEPFCFFICFFQTNLVLIPVHGEGGRLTEYKKCIHHSWRRFLYPMITAGHVWLVGRSYYCKSSLSWCPPSSTPLLYEAYVVDSLRLRCGAWRKVWSKSSHVSSILSFILSMTAFMLVFLTSFAHLTCHTPSSKREQYEEGEQDWSMISLWQL